MFSGSKFMLTKLTDYDLPTLRINDVCLQSVKSYTYLGLPLDCCLNFDQADRAIVKKVHSKLHSLSLVRNI